MMYIPFLLVLISENIERMEWLWHETERLRFRALRSNQLTYLTKLS